MVQQTYSLAWSNKHTSLAWSNKHTSLAWSNKHASLAWSSKHASLAWTNNVPSKPMCLAVRLGMSMQLDMPGHGFGHAPSHALGVCRACARARAWHSLLGTCLDHPSGVPWPRYATWHSLLGMRPGSRPGFCTWRLMWGMRDGEGLFAMGIVRWGHVLGVCAGRRLGAWHTVHRPPSCQWHWAMREPSHNNSILF